ncbi:CUB and peptidase domain-containing protein 1-like [Armigeres subalbatus]|uniref:CUB and peptidase domain-containing protein 1-like n=1 Tax=Armigeres subalbatus TaxID=124917 RepID=UPI002ED3F75B
MTSFVRSIVLSVGFLSILVKGQEFEFFTDTPPEDYFQRQSLDDCPSRFYPDPHRFSVSHVLGGERAIAGEFMHMASIGWTTDGITQYLCGGALISSKFVLTAAHCAVNGAGNQPDTVRLGDTNLAAVEDDDTAQQIGVRSFRKHPEYRPSRKYFDIALIELETEAVFNQAICSACLWLEADVPEEPMQAIGFGATGFGENLSPTLQKVTLSAIDKKTCTEQVPVSRRQQPNGFVDAQFCAGSDHMDTCEGDSGGPIQIEREDIDGSLVPLIVGVVSYGTPCSNGSLGVYTRVASYRDWIEQELEHHVDYLTCTRTSTCYGRKHVNSIISNFCFLGPIFRVGILWNTTALNAFECGATIIDYRFVITSASCLQLRNDKPHSIILESTGETVPIDEITIHPEFNADKPQNDIALLKLSKFVKHDMKVVPACLWKQNDTDREEGLQSVSAYGTKRASKEFFKKDDYERYVIDTLTGADDSELCQNSEHAQNNLYCLNNFIELIPTVCNMDYGGPVTRKSFVTPVPYLFGLVSKFSEGCGKDLVVTKIEPHIEWIESVVLNDRDSDLGVE